MATSTVPAATSTSHLRCVAVLYATLGAHWPLQTHHASPLEGHPLSGGCPRCGVSMPVEPVLTVEWSGSGDRFV
jgi:hypothetical protein